MTNEPMTNGIPGGMTNDQWTKKGETNGVEVVARRITGQTNCLAQLIRNGWSLTGEAAGTDNHDAGNSNRD